jgi:hypothetical protein
VLLTTREVTETLYLTELNVKAGLVDAPKSKPRARKYFLTGPTGQASHDIRRVPYASVYSGVSMNE